VQAPSENEQTVEAGGVAAAVLDSMGEAAALFDRAGRVRAWNSAMARLTGVAPGQALGQPLAAVAPWLAKAGRGRALDAVLRSRRAASSRLQWPPTKAGVPGRGEAIWRPLAEGERGLAGLVVVRQLKTRRAPHGAMVDATPLLRDLLHHMPGVVYRRVRHPDGTISYPYVSPNVERILGLKPSAIQADPRVLTGIIHPQDRVRWRSAIERSAAEMAPIEIDFRCRTVSGELRWFRSIGAPQRLDDGSIAWDSISLDISGLKEREAALEDVQARLRDVTAAASDWVWETDEELRFTYFSERFQEVTGIAPERLLGRTRTQVYGPSPDDPNWRQHIADLEARRPFRDFEFSSEGLPGPTRYYKISGVPVFDAQGRFAGYRGMGKEVTAQHQMEAQLRESERRFRDIADAASDWIWEMDAELRFTYISERFAEVTGMDAALVLGRTRRELAGGPRDQADREVWQAHLDDLQAHRPFRNFRYAYRDRDGRLFHAMVSGHPVFDERGVFKGYRGTGTDITVQVEAEQQAAEQQRLLADAVEALDQGFALFDDQDRLYLCNSTYRRMHGDGALERGTPYAALVRAALAQGLYPDAVGQEEIWLGRLLAVHRAADGQAYEYRIRDERWIATSKYRLNNGWVATIRVDITELKRREAALRESEDRFRALAEATFEGVVVHDHERIIDANKAFVDLLGYRYAELIELDVPGLVSPQSQREVAQRISGGFDEPYELTMRRKDGSTFPAEVRGKSVPFQGKLARVVAMRDISERKRAEEHIRHMAHHDSLTGLPNRALFLDRLSQAMAQARRSGRSMAILQLDLDHFKDVNDTLGHHAGDDLLREIAQRLRACVHDTDTVARLGGDEFAVILTGLERPTDAGRVAQRIVGQLTEPVIYQSHQIHTGASIGITIFPEDDIDPDQLLKNADIALYRAKANGRNTYSFFVEAMKRQVELRKELEVELRRALARHEFVMHYQPQISLGDRRVVGMEALLRWQHPARGLIGPGEFLSVAEETGLIVPIGLAILSQAAAQARVWLDHGVPFGRLAVNLAPAQFRTGRLARVVRDLLHGAGVPPQHFELEVTEGVFVGRGSGHVAETLGRLHRMHIQIALDDFGTGYASLAHLKQFPIDRLKIDRSFVRDIGTDPEDAAIVRTVISLGHSLGIEVVAEGVETEEQREFLRLHRCDAGQGYLFSAPLPADEATRFLRDAAAGPRVGGRTLVGVARPDH
jgi:diguanylate cyclase (GGDEF)-like protein/PAS domain S-box-containing protein